MGKEDNIDNIPENVWKAYFSGVMLTSEKERVEAFFKNNPEFEEELKNFTSEDVLVVSKITKKVNERINSKLGKKSTPLYWIGTAVVVLVVAGVFLFNNNKDSKMTIASINESQQISNDTIAKQVVDLTVEQTADTLFYFERKGSEIKVEELLPKEVPKENPGDNNDSDMLANEVVEVNEIEVVEPKEELNKSFFSTIDYRQTVYVEDNFYSESKSSGNTTSYASPIKGYSYTQEGMPNFKGSDEALLNYINEQLTSDKLLMGIKKKMTANLSFIVTNKGKVKDVLVQNCNNRQIGLSLMEIMENMPDWNPSEYKGKKGKVHYVLKIVFE